MAYSPSHKFGQHIGKLLEDIVLYKILKPRLQFFAEDKKYYLDWQRDRPARKGKKVTWEDKYENKHDLDFVLEIDGTDYKKGRPIAFIEAAWRRYTKHSKNKAQEIQGALLPIVEHHHLSAPFYGVVLAGEFTQPAIDQLKNHGFSVLYIPYKNIVSAFKDIGFDIAFDEKTADITFSNGIKKLSSLSVSDKNTLTQSIVNICEDDTNEFMTDLQNTLERYLSQIILIPLFGNRYEYDSIDAAMDKLNSLDISIVSGSFEKFEIIVDYNNQDTIRATFSDKKSALNFLNGLKN